MHQTSALRNHMKHMIGVLCIAAMAACGGPAPSGNNCGNTNRITYHWNFLDANSGQSITPRQAGVSSVRLNVVPDKGTARVFMSAADASVGNVPQTAQTDYFANGLYQIQFTAFDAFSGAPAYNSDSENIMLPTPKCADIGTYDVTVQPISGAMSAKILGGWRGDPEHNDYPIE